MKVADLPKPNTRIRRYLIEVKDPLGKSVFLTAAYWDEEDNGGGLDPAAGIR